jgi:hypothetical protein
MSTAPLASREQLKVLWSQWVKEQYPTEPEGRGNRGRMGNEAETPTGSDEEEAEGNVAGAAG